MPTVKARKEQSDDHRIHTEKNTRGKLENIGKRAITIVLDIEKHSIILHFLMMGVSQTFLLLSHFLNEKNQ